MLQIRDLLNKAKRAIAAGESSLRQAAELIAKAQSQGATQREIAKRVGKSPSWVNGLLRWHRAGGKGSPFGPQSKAQRTRAVQSVKQLRPPTTTEQAQAQMARAESERVKAEATKARAAAVTAMFGAPISNGQRMLLVKALEGLGSRNAEERASAALMADRLRARLGLAWNDLLVPAGAAESAKDRAA